MPPRGGGVKKAKAAKFYAVRRGHETGAFATWGECEQRTRGFSGAQFKSFPTMAQAAAYLAVAGIELNESTLNRPAEEVEEEVAAAQARLAATSNQAPRVVPDPEHVCILPVTDAPHQRIFCDGGDNAQTGNEAWGCVVDENNVDLLEAYQALLVDLPMRVADLPQPAGRRWVLVSKFDDVKYHQNNGAELMALLAGARIAKAMCTEYKYEGKPPLAPILCSDSKVVLAWSLGVDHPKQRAEMDARKLAYIDELARLRLHLTAAPHEATFLKISGDDNLADLGYHR